MHQQGIDPTQKRQIDKAAARVSAATTHEKVAREYQQVKARDWSESHSAKWLRMQEVDLFPWIGSLPLEDIGAPLLLETLRRVEKRGANETAHALRQYAGQVFRYGIATGRCTQDPAHGRYDEPAASRAWHAGAYPTHRHQSDPEYVDRGHLHRLHRDVCG